jgi:hypothetical protein
MNGEEEPEYVVWCTHSGDKSRTTFGPFPSKYYAEHFILNYGFTEGVYNLKAVPLNRITIEVENGKKKKRKATQTTH